MTLSKLVPTVWHVQLGKIIDPAKPYGIYAAWYQSNMEHKVKHLLDRQHKPEVSKTKQHAVETYSNGLSCHGTIMQVLCIDRAAAMLLDLALSLVDI